MSDRFVLYNGQGFTAEHVVTTALDEAAAVAAGGAPGLSSSYVWVEFQLEDDGVTRCNGVTRPDLPPYAGA